jgi:uncharacterized membrane protein
MRVDVLTEIEIDRPRSEVAAFAADPDNASDWYENISSVEWRTKKRRLAIGAEIAFVGALLGRRLSYTYRVTELIPGERLVMSTSSGAFPMETTYTWEDTPDGSTRMTLRNRGVPSGFSKLATPFMAGAMRRANRNDLRRLKELLEAG